MGFSNDAGDYIVCAHRHIRFRKGVKEYLDHLLFQVLAREWERAATTHALCLYQDSEIVPWLLTPACFSKAVVGYCTQACLPVLFRVDNKCTNCTFQYLCPRRDFQLSNAPTPPGAALRLSNESSSHVVWMLFKILFIGSLGKWDYMWCL